LLTILCNQFEISIKAWVILDNHYHILVKLKQGRSLPLFIRSLHGKSSFEFNRLDNARRRQVWQNYWDTCIHTEIDFWKRFNYIHHNPVKHGYVNNLKEWKFSSYEQYVQEKGEKWLEEILDSYPIIDFTDIPEHKD
jgi:putative transposase